MSQGLSTTKLAQWADELDKDIGTQLAASVLRTYNSHEALINRDVAIKNTTNIFNTAVKPEGAPVTNQKSSGRCWIFASTNMMRIKLMELYNLKEFQFSQSYLFFYDKLEKSNYFLEKFVEKIDEEGAEGALDSRLIQTLLEDPVSDGGQFDMLVNIVEKYGLLPYSMYPDAYSSTASLTVNFLIKTKLRDFAEILRQAKKDGIDLDALKTKMQQEIHRLLIITLGKPPQTSDQLTWEYVDKDDKIGKIDFTPLSLYKDILKIDLTKHVSLLNDPRNDYNRNIKIEDLGNVVEGKGVRYLNLSIDEVIEYSVKRLQNNKAIFFGTHSPLYMDKKRGILDQSLFDYKLINFETNQKKSSRIEYRQSLMTHAMLITAVHLDDEGKPIRWKVENSWGETSGQKGFYVMDNEYFKQYVYQVVVEESELSEEHKLIVKDTKNDIVLPVWDPMGALATFKYEYEQ